MKKLTILPAAIALVATGAAPVRAGNIAAPVDDPFVLPAGEKAASGFGIDPVPATTGGVALACLLLCGNSSSAATSSTSP